VGSLVKTKAQPESLQLISLRYSFHSSFLIVPNDLLRLPV